MTTWNFLPFLLKRVGVAPAWAVRVAFAVWYAGLAAFGNDALASPVRHFEIQVPSTRQYTLKPMQRAYIGMGAKSPQPRRSSGGHAGRNRRAPRIFGPHRRPLFALFHQARWNRRPASLRQRCRCSRNRSGPAHAAQSPTRNRTRIWPRSLNGPPERTSHARFRYPVDGGPLHP